MIDFLLQILFWLCIGIVFYSYVGYGVLLFIIVKIKRIISPVQDFDEENFFPEVTLVVPCYNEAEYIEDKIKNSLALDYPKEKLKFVFISDGSTDDTHERIKKYPQILALHEPDRNGKAAAMNRAMKYVQTPVVVFCDANTQINREAIHEMVKHYANPQVGAVTGEKRIISGSKENASTAGEGIYWKYESFLKQYDSDLYTIVGAAGELMSYRTELYKDLPKDTLLDDLMQSMQIAIEGYRVIYEKDAWAAETASLNVEEELKRKIRICAGAWQSMIRLPKAFNPFHNFTLSFLFISHRVLRWTLAPFSLLIILLINVYLHYTSDGWYTQLLIAQLTFYALALLGWYFENQKIQIKIFFVPYYFFIMNVSVFLGLARFIKGKQSVSWERSKRA